MFRFAAAQWSTPNLLTSPSPEYLLSPKPLEVFCDPAPNRLKGTAPKHLNFIEGAAGVFYLVDNKVWATGLLTERENPERREFKIPTIIPELSEKNVIALRGDSDRFFAIADDGVYAFGRNHLLGVEDLESPYINIWSRVIIFEDLNMQVIDIGVSQCGIAALMRNAEGHHELYYIFEPNLLEEQDNAADEVNDELDMEEFRARYRLPIQLPPKDGRAQQIASIAAGKNHLLILTTLGSAYSCGYVHADHEHESMALGYLEPICHKQSGFVHLRKIDGLQDQPISQVAATENNSYFLSEDRRKLWQCGAKFGTRLSTTPLRTLLDSHDPIVQIFSQGNMALVLTSRQLYLIGIEIPNLATLVEPLEFFYTFPRSDPLRPILDVAFLIDSNPEKRGFLIIQPEGVIYFRTSGIGIIKDLVQHNRVAQTAQKRSVSTFRMDPSVALPEELFPKILSYLEDQTALSRLLLVNRNWLYLIMTLMKPIMHYWYRKNNSYKPLSMLDPSIKLNGDGNGVYTKLQAGKLSIKSEGCNWGAFGRGNFSFSFSCEWQSLPIPDPLVQVCVGRKYILALTSKGLVISWGKYANGGLGRIVRDNLLYCGTPTRISSLGDEKLPLFRSIAANHQLSIAASANELWMWGNKGGNSSEVMPIRRHRTIVKVLVASETIVKGEISMVRPQTNEFGAIILTSKGNLIVCSDNSEEPATLTLLKELESLPPIKDFVALYANTIAIDANNQYWYVDHIKALMGQAGYVTQKLDMNPHPDVGSNFAFNGQGHLMVISAENNLLDWHIQRDGPFRPHISCFPTPLHWPRVPAILWNSILQKENIKRSQSNSANQYSSYKLLSNNSSLFNRLSRQQYIDLRFAHRDDSATSRRIFDEEFALTVPVSRKPLC